MNRRKILAVLFCCVQILQSWFSPHAFYTQKQYQIYYVAVCSVPNVQSFGSVSISGELKVNGFTGSTATEGMGFKFVDWYLDEDCTESVTDVVGMVTDNKFTPLDSYVHKNATPNEKTGIDEITFYALFEPVTSELTIKKDIENPSSESSTESFIFHVQGQGKFDYIDLYVSVTGEGSVTIADVPVGEYTVEELTAWSWEYTVNGNAYVDATVTTEGATVTFTNKPVMSNWLEGETVNDDTFASVMTDNETNS